jgi:formylglycine-generating enzyme required for sulfatase activity
MKNKTFLIVASAIVIVAVPMAMPGHANNISVGTPTLAGQNTTDDYTFVQFDLSWDHSWRDEINWDAAWVFVKYQETDSTQWKHAYLNTTAGNHTIPSGYTCSVGVTDIGGTDRGMGVFIYRSSSGSGNNSLSDVRLRWEYGANGLSDDATITVKVFAIEMVYVPQDTLNLNTAGSASISNEFFDDGGSTTQITSENALGEGAIRWKKDGTFGGTGNETGTSYGSDALGASYPKGYGAFHCMKYEISQGQYADFLNTILSTQAASLYPNQNGNNRHTISKPSTYSASRPDRACNYLSWMDGCAYADWAGLRPMTELEFEKACRGEQSVVADEFAWGTTNITAATTISGPEDGTETITTTGANCCYNSQTFTGGDGGLGPLRCGIFAKSSTSREQAGASYYGIMELSGNLWERCITVADRDHNAITTNAGQFDGSHGDGSLSIDGYATNSTWPGYSGGEVTGARGADLRGASCGSGASFGCVSDRWLAGNTSTGRSYAYGFRCVRSGP